MNPRPSTRIDAERNRRALLDSAGAALAANPEASLSEVAHLAGLARATLYRHFDSRENLMSALREDAIACAREAIADADVDAGTSQEALRRVVERILSFGGRFRPLLVEGADSDPDFLRKRQEIFGPVAALIERGQLAGEIRRDISPGWVLTAFMAILAAGARTAQETSNADIAEMVFGTLTSGIQNSTR